jgi:hypothetical protein
MINFDEGDYWFFIFKIIYLFSYIPPVLCWRTVVMQYFGKFVKISYLCIPNFRRALIFVPHEGITIRTNWITNDIKCAIRKKNCHRTRAKHSKSVLDWERFRHIRNECTSKIRNAQITYFDKLSKILHDDSTSTKDWWNIAKQIYNFKNRK